MTKSTKSATKPSADEAVKKAVEEHPGATAEGVASAAGIGRSTATKALARLRDAGQLTRYEGGRERGRRLPDRYTLAGTELPPADAGHTASGSGAKAETAKQSSTATPAKTTGAKSASVADGKPSAADAERLRPGQLEPLVLAYLKENADSGPHGPSTVAKALVRSSGAVSNCLTRLTKAKQVRQDSDKPRRYSLAA